MGKGSEIRHSRDVFARVNPCVYLLSIIPSCIYHQRHVRRFHSTHDTSKHCHHPGSGDFGARKHGRIAGRITDARHPSHRSDWRQRGRKKQLVPIDQRSRPTSVRSSAHTQFRTGNNSPCHWNDVSELRRTNHLPHGRRGIGAESASSSLVTRRDAKPCTKLAVRSRLRGLGASRHWQLEPRPAPACVLAGFTHWLSPHFVAR